MDLAGMFRLFTQWNWACLPWDEEGMVAVSSCFRYCDVDGAGDGGAWRKGSCSTSGVEEARRPRSIRRL